MRPNCKYPTIVDRPRAVFAGLHADEAAMQRARRAVVCPSPPPAGASLHGQVVLEIQNSAAILPFTVSIVADGDLLLNSAERISSQ